MAKLRAVASAVSSALTGPSARAAAAPTTRMATGFASITSLFFSWTGFKPRSVRVTGRASAPHREAGDDQGDRRHAQNHRDPVQAAARPPLLEDSAYHRPPADP